MNHSINRKSAISTLIYSIFIIFLFGLVINFNSMLYDTWINFIFYITIISLLITLICFKYSQIKIISLSGVFIILSYIFHLGQIIIKGINKKYYFSFDVSLIMSKDIYIKSTIFSIFIILLVSLGIIISNLFNKKDHIYVRNSLNTNTEYEKILKLGYLILVLTLPIEIYYTVIEFITAKQSGYLDVLNVKSSGVMSQLARFHLIGIGLLIMGYSKTPKKATLIFIGYISYLLITMLNGGRIYQSISILLISYILIKSTNKKISFKLVFIMGIIALILMFLLNLVAEVRVEGITNIVNIESILSDMLNNNQLYDALEEFGSTIYTVCLTIINVPNIVGYSHGEQFITSFVSILPNINGVFTELINSANFVFKLETEAIGGSYIAELYYSFQYIAYVIAILIGFIVQKISFKFEEYLDTKQFTKAAYFIMPVFSLILWIRGMYIGLLRNSIWSICFIFLLYKIFINRSDRVK